MENKSLGIIALICSIIGISFLPLALIGIFMGYASHSDEGKWAMGIGIITSLLSIIVMIFLSSYL